MTAAAECMIPAAVARRNELLLAVINRINDLWQLPDDPFDTRAWIPVARQTPRTPTFFPQMKVRGGRRRHGQRSTQQANRYANGGVVWIDEANRMANETLLKMEAAMAGYAVPVNVRDCTYRPMLP